MKVAEGWSISPQTLASTPTSDDVGICGQLRHTSSEAGLWLGRSHPG
jgi:hypothetical protein